MKKQAKFRPNQIVEPIQPVAIDYDVDGVLISGVFNPKHSKLRGDHPAVQSNPGLFKPLQPEGDDESPSSTAA